MIYLIIAFFLMGHANRVVAAGPVSDPSAKHILEVTSTDSRSRILYEYLKSKSSPMAQEANTLVSYADRNNLDWKLVAAIAGVESTFGKHIPSGSYNPFGWGVFTGEQDGVHFTSWADGIATVSEGLRTKYINKGSRTVEEIGSIYASSPVWSTKVKSIISDIERFQSKSSKTLAVTI